MGKASVIEIVLAIFALIIAGVVIALNIALITNIFAGTATNGEIVVMIVTLIIIAFNIAIAVFFIKKQKCNKLDGTMVSFHCNQI